MLGVDVDDTEFLPGGFGESKNFLMNPFDGLGAIWPSNKKLLVGFADRRSNGLC